MSSNSGRFPDDWFNFLKSSIQSENFRELREFVSGEREIFEIYPEKEDVFRAFIETPFEKVKVVILGQDPYHGKGQAHGLAFSVKDGVATPPSLKNIFQELNSDIGVESPNSGDLTKWANRGVFLLNTVLTVREGQANSHRDRGWEEFTDSVIHTISKEKEGIVFILWGRPAQSKANLIDSTKHHIIQAPHPSPLSAFRGFFDSKPFSETNRYLKNRGDVPINWDLN
jgi:uracil-DNA glycosylase